jgi:hypothetical protein
LYTRKQGKLVVGVTTALMFPVVVKATGVVVVKTKHNICAPAIGGVTVAIAVVPLIKVRKPLGATVVVEAIVTGLGCNAL